MQTPLSLFYETKGLPTHPCIILIMGLGGQLIHWPAALIDGLVENGFYVVTFDNRDSGLSPKYDYTKIPDLNQVISAMHRGQFVLPPYTLRDMAADVIHLMDKLNIQKAHILGFSMGGMIAQLLAIHYSERMLSLICIGTTSGNFQLPPAKPEIAKLFSLPQGVREDLDSYISTRIKIHKLYNHPSHVNEEKVREIATKAFQRAYRPDGFLRQLTAIMCEKPRDEKLKKCHLPALIIHGDYDPLFLIEHAKHLAACIPGSQLEIVENMGHALPDSLCERLVKRITSFITS